MQTNDAATRRRAGHHGTSRPRVPVGSAENLRLTAVANGAGMGGKETSKREKGGSVDAILSIFLSIL
jgi:hypothetical protein